MGKSFRTCAAALAAALSSLGVAHAAPAVDLAQVYESVCARPANTSEAVAAARSQGFVTPPAAYTRDLGPTDPEDAQLWKALDGRMLMLILKRDHFPGYDDLDSTTCHIFLTPGDLSAAAELQSKLGLGPGDVGKDKTSTLVFAETPQGRKLLDPADDAAMSSAAHDGSLRVVVYGPMSGKDAKDTIVIQLRPRPR